MSNIINFLYQQTAMLMAKMGQESFNNQTKIMSFKDIKQLVDDYITLQKGGA